MNVAINYYLCRSMFRYVTLQHMRDHAVLELSWHAVTSINHVDQTLCWGWLNVISGHSSSPCCRRITYFLVGGKKNNVV